MKTILASILTFTFVINLYANEGGAKQFACGEVGNKTFTCSQDQLLEAFHSLQTLKQVKDKETARRSMVENTGKTFLTVGTVTFLLGGLAYNRDFQPAVGNLSYKILRMVGFRSMTKAAVVGLGSMAVGAVVLALQPSELSSDDTITSLLSSDKGTNLLLSLTDKQLMSYAEEDAQVSIRVMKIFAAVSVIAQEK